MLTLTCPTICLSSDTLGTVQPLRPCPMWCVHLVVALFFFRGGGGKWDLSVMKA